MKKIILIIVLLLISVNLFAQKIQFADTSGGKVVLREVSYKWPLPIRLTGINFNPLTFDTTKIGYLNKNNNWTGINIFDTVVINHIDSTISTYWYKPSGALFGFIDASRDSASFEKMYVGALGTYTIVNGTSVTTSSLVSDTVIGHSPINLLADSVIVQNRLFLGSLYFSGTQFIPATKQDTSSYFAYRNANIIPTVTATDNLGSTDLKFKNIYSSDSLVGTNGSFSGKVGIGITSPKAPIDVFAAAPTSTQIPANTGTTPLNPMGRFANDRGVTLDIGGQYDAPYGLWIQVSDINNLATHYPLFLNPNGGDVLMGGNVTLGSTVGTGTGSLYLKNILFKGTDSTTAGLTATPVFTSYYGGNTNALGDPAKWMQVTLNGINYLVPLYIKP